MPLPDAAREPDQQPDADHDERAGTERLVFFSDAVLAIALTLLAIELPVPEQAGSAEMLHAAGQNWPEYLAFLISFAVIGAHWRLHHRVFAHVHRAPQLLIRLNQNWLLLAVVTPFLTRLLSEGDLNIVRFLPYAAAQTLQFGLMAAMIAVIRRRGLAGDGPWTTGLRSTAYSSAAIAVAFAVSIPVYLLAGEWAFAAWVVVPRLAGLLRRARERQDVRRPAPAGKTPQHE